MCAVAVASLLMAFQERIKKAKIIMINATQTWLIVALYYIHLYILLYTHR